MQKVLPPTRGHYGEIIIDVCRKFTVHIVCFILFYFFLNLEYIFVYVNQFGQIIKSFTLNMVHVVFVFLWPFLNHALYADIRIWKLRLHYVPPTYINTDWVHCGRTLSSKQKCGTTLLCKVLLSARYFHNPWKIPIFVVLYCFYYVVLVSFTSETLNKSYIQHNLYCWYFF